MSLYREAGRFGQRALVIGVLVAMVAGLAGGFALGRATAPDETLADRLTEFRDDLAPATQGLLLVPPEYAQGVRGGKVVARPEYDAAKSAARRATETIGRERSGLEALSRSRAQTVEARVRRLSQAVEDIAPPDRVKVLSEAAAAALNDALGR